MVQYVNIPRNNFVQGLVTEVSELGFPENASVDELNCELNKDGSRRRRLGVNVEPNSSPSSETYTEGQVTRVLTWENVGGEPGIEFAVVQIGSRVRFYDKSAVTISSEEVPVSFSDSSVFIIDLETYARPLGNGSSTSEIQVASIKGGLVIASPEINTILVERDADTGVFTVSEITFRERDFEYLGDKTTYYEAQSLTPADTNREYDTKNSGWREDATDPNAAYDIYTTGESNYPPLNIPWHSAKNSSDVFTLATFNKLANEGQTSLIGNGRFILNLYQGDREAASGITGVTADTEATRFSTVAPFGNRVFFSGLTSKKRSSRVYFTQSLTDLSLIGDLHSVNDPTAEFFSDALDTDGGFIDIPEAYDIKVLYPWRNVLLVFADNGVWSIDGIDEVFTPTAFRVRKIFDTGIEVATSFASLEGVPFWWGVDGIYTVTTDQVGNTTPQDLSTSTIQSFWNLIDVDSRRQVFSEVDTVEKRILWFYPSNDSTVDYKYNHILLFDLRLGAFYPWTISDQSSNTKYIIGSTYYRNFGVAGVDTQIIDSLGNTVVDSSLNNVVTNVNATITGDGIKVKLLVRNNDGSIQWGEFNEVSFLDWGDTNFSSFAVSRHEFGGDLLSKKTSPYAVVYCKVTETGFEASGDGYTSVREGSCKVSAFWDFKETPATSSQQGYRLKLPLAVDENNLDSFGYPFDIVQTRLRLRGRGRTLRIKFESEQGKDFNLVGWVLVGAGNERF